MKIELKNIKHFAAGSEETYCYTASLWVDGKRIGEVSNDGHGGCDRFSGEQAAYAEADAWCKANMPHWTLEEDGKVIHEGASNLEIVCTDLVTLWFRRKDYLRARRGKVLFIKPDTRGVFAVRCTGHPAPTIKRLAAKYPGATFLNTMTVAEAVKLFVENTDHV